MAEAKQRSDFKEWQPLDELNIDMSEDELLKQVKSWKSIASDAESILKDCGEKNKDYYKGLDHRTREILDDKSKVTDNRIFTDLESIVPMVTSRPAKPIVILPPSHLKWNDEKKIREQAIKNQRILTAIYQEQKMQKEYEKLVRQHQIWRLWCIKYWIQDDKIFAVAVLPSRLLIDSEAVSIEDSEFVWEKVVKTAKKLIQKYPDKEDKISSVVQGKLGTKVTYIEWWTSEMKVVSLWENCILDAVKNPLFDYTWIPKEETDDFWTKIKWEPTMNNIFERPKIPYIFFNVFNIGESIIDDVTPLELCKSLQDGINDRKRQIADNANVAGNPIRTYRGMTEEQAELADSNLEAWDGVNLDSEQQINYVQAVPLPAFVQNDLQDSRNAIDNIFGIHATTRWERVWWANESWDAREVLREWDQWRQATIGRALEDVSEELYNAFAHLVKVFYWKEQTLPILGEKDAEDYVSFKRDDIMDGMQIRVVPWSNIPEDPNARKAQALWLLDRKAISVRKAYEMMWIEDADELAEDLELEQVKAEKRQQEELQRENDKMNKEKTRNSLRQKIQQIWQQQ